MLGAAPPKRVGDVGSFKKVPTRGTPNTHSLIIPPSPWGSLRESRRENALGVLGEYKPGKCHLPFG